MGFLKLKKLVPSHRRCGALKKTQCSTQSPSAGLNLKPVIGMVMVTSLCELNMIEENIYYFQQCMSS